MSNLETYKNCFIEGLEIDESLVEEASMDTVEKWDSIGQMSLITLMEDAFSIEFEPEDIIGLTSYEKGLEILRNHGIEI